jgi:hypothetical protein
MLKKIWVSAIECHLFTPVNTKQIQTAALSCDVHLTGLMNLRLRFTNPKLGLLRYDMIMCVMKMIYMLRYGYVHDENVFVLRWLCAG